MRVLMGVGNEMRGDDGIGAYIAEQFSAEGWKSFNCQTIPENYVTKICKMNPELVVIVDAADMGIAPGEVRLIPREKMSDLALSTHSMPLGLVMDHLAPAKVVLIGIQPKQIGEFLDLSDEAKTAAKRVMHALSSSSFFSLPSL